MEFLYEGDSTGQTNELCCSRHKGQSSDRLTCVSKQWAYPVVARFRRRELALVGSVVCSCLLVMDGGRCTEGGNFRLVVTIKMGLHHHK